MKRVLFCLALFAMPLFASAQVGISINIGHPDFYGQINIGNQPPPQLIYSEPIIVQAPPTEVVYAPMYLRVPEEQHKYWKNYCHQYNACNRKVYFVTDDWYHDNYGRQYEHDHGHGHGHDHDDDEHDHGHGHGHGHDHDDEH